jgi:3-hydroxyphenylacetate 6-hydroxylase
MKWMSLADQADLLQHCLVWILVSTVAYILVNEQQRYCSRIKGLRGPRGWPIIGNILDIRTLAAQKYAEWSRVYGDVYQVQLGNTTIVIVNSAASIRKLWLSNSQALASRPHTYTYHKMATGSSGLTIGTSPYDDSLKKRKKGAAVALNRPAIQSYVPYLDIESRDFVRDLSTYGKMGRVPIDPLPMIQRLSLSLAVTINWGIRVPTIEDPFFTEVVEVEEELNRARSTTGNLQDFIPLLRLNPFNRATTKAKEMKARREKYLRALNKDLADKVAKGTNKPCIQANVITYKEEPINEIELLSISLSVLAGGFETVASTVQFAIGYLSQHPELQERAFDAIRAFQGHDGLPDADDDLGCAYIVGFAKESLRYFCVLPLALPRVSIVDLEHDGVHIPKGTQFHMNAFSGNRDPALWKDPDVFRPERWIENPEAPLFTFGLGYRMCSAHMLALRELYLVFMRLLSTFRIETSSDINYDPISGLRDPRDLIMQPRQYQVLCIPRDEEALMKSLAVPVEGLPI